MRRRRTLDDQVLGSIPVQVVPFADSISTLKILGQFFAVLLLAFEKCSFAFLLAKHEPPQKCTFLELEFGHCCCDNISSVSLLQGFDY